MYVDMGCCQAKHWITWHWFSSQGPHDKDTNINDVKDGNLCDVRHLVKEVLPDDTWKAYQVTWSHRPRDRDCDWEVNVLALTFAFWKILQERDKFMKELVIYKKNCKGIEKIQKPGPKMVAKIITRSPKVTDKIF